MNLLILDFDNTSGWAIRRHIGEWNENDRTACRIEYRELDGKRTFGHYPGELPSAIADLREPEVGEPAVIVFAVEVLR